MSASATIEVGDAVIVRFGPRRLVAEVLEDRGRLGSDDDRILRVGWTPAESEERYEAEVPESAVVRAHPHEERARALARIDEWSVRSPVVGGGEGGAMARLVEAHQHLDRAVKAAQSRGLPRDYELVHRVCVEELGPAALTARRLWTESSGANHVNPTLNRLPAMIDEVGVDTAWINAADPLTTWYRLLTAQLSDLETAQLGAPTVGSRLVRVVGYCAEMAAWIRMSYAVGD